MSLAESELRTRRNRGAGDRLSMRTRRADSLKPRDVTLRISQYVFKRAHSIHGYEVTSFLTLFVYSRPLFFEVLDGPFGFALIQHLGGGIEKQH